MYLKLKFILPATKKWTHAECKNERKYIETTENNAFSTINRLMRTKTCNLE